MSQEKRRNKNSKKGILFYQFASGIFWLMSLFSFVFCCFYGFTDTRVVLILMNGWFGLFAMNMMTVRFKRKDEKQFWYDWKIFQRQSQNQQQSGFDLLPELDRQNSDLSIPDINSTYNNHNNNNKDVA